MCSQSTLLQSSLQDRYMVQPDIREPQRKLPGGKWIGIWVVLLTVSIVPGIIYFQAGGAYKNWLVAGWIILAVIHFICFEIFRSGMTEGRVISLHLYDFRKYLSMHINHWKKQFPENNSPGKVFERYLPYAVAMHVEDQWLEKFGFQHKKPGGHGTENRNEFSSASSKVLVALSVKMLADIPEIISGAIQPARRTFEESNPAKYIHPAS